MSDWKDKLRDDLGIERQENIWDFSVDNLELPVMDVSIEKSNDEDCNTIVQWDWGDGSIDSNSKSSYFQEDNDFIKKLVKYLEDEGAYEGF